MGEDAVPGRFSVRGRLALGGELVPGTLVVEDGRIAEIRRGETGEAPQSVHQAAIVAPGYIDLQVNGGFGVDIGESAEPIQTLARRLPERGVTGFLPTMVTSPDEVYPGVFAAFEAARSAPGARAFGLHLEGPFLSPLRAGAHRVEIIEAARPELLESLLEAGSMRLMTLAPERPHGHDLIRRLWAHDVLVSLGHSNATYEEFIEGVDAGAAMATHLFNAMSPFGHRTPNTIGAALLDDRVTAGLIVDGIHSHPASVQLAVRVKGPDRICLVSDIMTAAGMPPGVYTLAGRPVTVDRTSARLEDGTLAGAIVTLDQNVRSTVAWTGLPPAQVIRMATEVPARLIGESTTGRLLRGLDADLVLLDADLHVQSTFVRGRQVYG
jgi:N-acetylglucosamine-6-phosphate deacetylase